MPEAMLFAKLTLCSHGNGSCKSRIEKEKERKQKRREMNRSFLRGRGRDRQTVTVNKIKPFWIKLKNWPWPTYFNIIGDKNKNTLPLLPQLRAELNCSSETARCGRRGAKPFKYHLGTLSTTFLIPRLGQSTCQPAHYEAEGPLIYRSRVYFRSVPSHTANSSLWSLKGFFVLGCGGGGGGGGEG